MLKRYKALHKNSHSPQNGYVVAVSILREIKTIHKMLRCQLQYPVMNY